MRAAAAEMGDDTGPAPARFIQGPLGHQQAQIGAAILDGLQPGIATGKQHHLHMPGERCRLAGVEPVIHLEADEVAGPAAPTRIANVVLAGGEHDAIGFQPSQPLHLHPARHQPAHRMTAEHPGAVEGCLSQQRLIQHAAGQAHARAGQRRRHNASAMHQPHRSDAGGAQAGDVDAQPRQPGLRLPTDELATDLVVRPGLTFHQRREGAKQARGCSTGNAAARDQHSHFSLATHQRNGTCQRSSAPSMPACRNRRRHSSRRKLRATLIGPSCRTKRCQPAAADSARNP